MSSAFDNTDRFLRATDAGRIRRNQRQIAVERFLAILRNIVLFLLAIVGAVWLYFHTQSDARFAVRNIEISGALHTSRAALEALTRQYGGLNLFRLDIARVQRDFESMSWVRRINIEKKLPDTLRIHITERVPVALLRDHDRLLYVDVEGKAFADLDASVGDDDLPIITDASGAELTRAIALLESLRAADSGLYSRVAEIRPIAPRGFALFDRELQTLVYGNAEDVVEKWRDLYAIARAERLGAGSIEYADLRFADRLIVKPVHPMTIAVTPLPRPNAAEITN
ncbi:MAG: cell division protein FtsQ/DivIB [Thermoanaerobaculia bacterium]